VIYSEQREGAARQILLFRLVDWKEKGKREKQLVVSQRHPETQIIRRKMLKPHAPERPRKGEERGT